MLFVKPRVRKLACLLTAITLLLTGACAPANMATAAPTRPPVETPAPSAAPHKPASIAPIAASDDPGATDTAAPETDSLTTGLRLSGAPRPPVLAVIGNAPNVRPQTGLMQADIIYEFVLDRGDTTTRLVALYSDEYPALAGPIQSARIYFFDLQRKYEGMMVYNGYPEEAGYPQFNEAEIDIPAAYSDELRYLFTRDTTVNGEQSNTLFCRIDELGDALYGAGGPALQPRFRFDEDVAYAGAKPFKKVGLSFSGKDTGKIEFVYNGEENMLYRYERNSKGALVLSKTLTVAQDGAQKSEPVRVQNLIVQYVKYTPISDAYYSAALIGSGACDYFIGGKYTPGYWRRDALNGTTAYYLRDGSPLALFPGTTWIAMHSDQRQIKIQYGA